MDAQVQHVASQGGKDDVPRRTLAELIARYGLGLCDEPRRCEGLLRDFCGAYRREIHLLVSALKEHIAADLLAPDPLPRPMKVLRLAGRLQNTLGVTEAAAVWAVNSWALVLGVLAPEEIRDVMPGSNGIEIAGDTTPSAGLRTVTTAPPPTASGPLRCPGCRGPVGPEDQHCPGCGQALLLACPRCGSISRAEAKHCPQCGLDLVLRRQFDDAMRRGREALAAAAACKGRAECWRHVETALAALTQAGKLPAGDLELQAQLEKARSRAVQIAWECGDHAFRQDRLGEAAGCLRCLLELDATYQAATERLRAITATRQQLLDEAGAALTGGQIKPALRILRRAAGLFSQDAEISQLIATCEKQIVATTEVLDQRIPELTREKKLCELRQLLDHLEASGVQVQGIVQYKASLEKKLESVVPWVQAAELSLAGRGYRQAIQYCQAVLGVVADHQQAQQIAATAQERLAALTAGLDAVRAAIDAARWWEAKRLLRPLEEEGSNQEVQQFRREVDINLGRARNYWRLLVMALLGGGLWLATGWLALLFGQGIAQLVQQDVLGQYRFDREALALALTWASQVLFAALALPFLAAVLTDVRSLSVMGRLIAIASLGAVLLASGAWLDRLGLRSMASLWALVQGTIYGMTTAVLLTLTARRLLKTSLPIGFTWPIVVGGLMVTGVSLVAWLPGVWHPEVLTTYVLAAVLLWSLLAVTGLRRGRLSEVLPLPVAVLLAYGLELGVKPSGLGGWQWLWPLVGGTLLAVAVLPAQAPSLRWPRAVGTLVMGWLAALLAVLVMHFDTAPHSRLLLVAWFSAWAMHATCAGSDLLPSFQVADWYRFYRDAPVRGCLTATTDPVS
jgi:hypothetical protein